MDILQAVTMQKLFLTLWRLNTIKSYAEKQGISKQFIKPVFAK